MAKPKNDAKLKRDTYEAFNDLQLQIFRADTLLALMKTVVDPDVGPEAIEDHRRALEYLCEDVRGVLAAANKKAEELWPTIQRA